MVHQVSESRREDRLRLGRRPIEPETAVVTLHPQQSRGLQALLRNFLPEIYALLCKDTIGARGVQQRKRVTWCEAEGGGDPFDVFHTHLREQLSCGDLVIVCQSNPQTNGTVIGTICVPNVR